MISTQHKLDTLRPPRVQITYDVEVGDAVEVVELPFVFGVMADLSGDNATALPSLKERKFAELTPDNFGQVMQAAAPSLNLAVPDKQSNDGSMLAASLSFESLEDFEPQVIAQKILPDLYAERQHLNELLSKLVMSEELMTALENILTNEQSYNGLKQLLLGPVSSTPTGSDPKPSADAKK